MLKQQESEMLVRERIAERRAALGWTLADLAEHSGVNASTLSRIQSGERRLVLDVLVPVAAALGLSLDELVRPAAHEDIVIRPEAEKFGPITVWRLDDARRTGLPTVMKMRIPTDSRKPTLKTHPGHEWIYVLSGELLVHLDDTVHRVEPGQTVSFNTRHPHAIAAAHETCEVLAIFDEHGQRSHLHTNRSAR